MNKSVSEQAVHAAQDGKLLLRFLKEERGRFFSSAWLKKKNPLLYSAVGRLPAGHSFSIGFKSTRNEV
jgi:hypothetical protein